LPKHTTSCVRAPRHILHIAPPAAAPPHTISSGQGSAWPTISRGSAPRHYI